MNTLRVNLSLNFVDPADLKRAKAFLSDSLYVWSWRMLPRTADGILVAEVIFKGHDLKNITTVRRALKTRGVVANVVHVGR